MTFYAPRNIGPADQVLFDADGNAVGIQPAGSSSPPVLGFNPTKHAAIDSLVSGAGTLMRRVLALGTSITNKWTDPGTTTGIAGSFRTIQGDSYLWWMLTALGGRCETIINAGVSGNTTTQMLARYDADVAARYSEFDTLIFEPGPSDQNASLTAAVTLANCATIIEAARAAAKFVIVLTPTPSEFWDSAEAAIAQEVRQTLLTTYRAMSGVMVVDTAALLADPLTGQPLSALYAPTSVEATRVHPSLSGAQVMGRAIAQALPSLPYVAPYTPMGQRDHFELIPNPRLQGSNASGARNFFAGAGITVTGGPDSSAISIATGGFGTLTIASATATGATLNPVSGGSRITAVTAASARSEYRFRIGSTDTTVGGTQFGRWDLALANATYVIGDHATLAASPLGILECIVGGATGTTSATAPANYGETLTVGSAVFVWKRLPAAGDVVVPEVEYEIESQSGGFYLWCIAKLYRSLNDSESERWGDMQMGKIDQSATLSQGAPGLWMPRRGVLRGLPITLVNPGVALRHVCMEVRGIFDNGASATVRIDRASLRRVSA